MKKVAIFVAIAVVACGVPKDTLDFPTKCNLGQSTVWRYDHTEYWTTQEPTYGYRWAWDFEEGTYEWKYGQTGTETVQHSRDVYSCQNRR
jgi:hypothetical protein